MSRIGKYIETESRLVLAWGWREFGGGGAWRRMELFWGDENFLKLTVGIVAPVCQKTPLNYTIYMDELYGMWIIYR